MTTIDQTSRLDREIEHDETQGGTDGNPHAGSASMADLDGAGGDLDLIHVLTPSDLPPFTEVSDPTIAYVEDVDGEQNDDYAAIFKS